MRFKKKYFHNRWMIGRKHEKGYITQHRFEYLSLHTDNHHVRILVTGDPWMAEAFRPRFMGVPIKESYERTCGSDMVESLGGEAHFTVLDKNSGARRIHVDPANMGRIMIQDLIRSKNRDRYLWKDEGERIQGWNDEYDGSMGMIATEEKGSLVTY